VRAGGREEGRAGRREGGRAGRREGGKAGRREGERAGRREGERAGGREGGKAYPSGHVPLQPLGEDEEGRTDKVPKGEGSKLLPEGESQPEAVGEDAQNLRGGGRARGWREGGGGCEPDGGEGGREEG
jgi:hypothetical protein